MTDFHFGPINDTKKMTFWYKHGQRIIIITVFAILSMTAIACYYIFRQPEWPDNATPSTLVIVSSGRSYEAMVVRKKDQETGQDLLKIWFTHGLNSTIFSADYLGIKYQGRLVLVEAYEREDNGILLSLPLKDLGPWGATGDPAAQIRAALPDDTGRSNLGCPDNKFLQMDNMAEAYEYLSANNQGGVIFESTALMKEVVFLKNNVAGGIATFIDWPAKIRLSGGTIIYRFRAEKGMPGFLARTVSQDKLSESMFGFPCKPGNISFVSGRHPNANTKQLY